MEEEPNAVREEEVGLGSEDDDPEQILLVAGVLEVALEEEGAQLRDVELQVIPEHALEVRIDATFLQVLDRAGLVGVHPHHRLGYQQRPVVSAPLVKVEPLLEPLHEGLLRDSLGLLAADAAAEEIVEATTTPEEASCRSVNRVSNRMEGSYRQVQREN